MRPVVLAGWIFLATGICGRGAGAGDGETGAPAAAAAFESARNLCTADGGALWGRSLCGPILLVDPGTRAVFANQADAEGRLQPRGKIFVGELPVEINVANTALAWAGVRWTMLRLPLPADEERRRVLLAHELWHRVQADLGFASEEMGNEHLDTREGRSWLQLEWRALAAALQASAEKRAAATGDALLFRARRREIFPTAAAAERALEINEGLAEYTGVRLGARADRPRFVVEHELAEAPRQPSFVRAFAYATGPAYGLLLDDAQPGWRKALKIDDDLAALLARAVQFELPTNLAALAAKRAASYGAQELEETEERREREHAARRADYRARLVDGPVLIIPLAKMQLQFDPGDLVPLGAPGTVYPKIRIVDEWGILTVTRGGALLSSDFSRITVPAPEGAGWKLELRPGWEIQPAARAGDRILQPKK